MLDRQVDVKIRAVLSHNSLKKGTKKNKKSSSGGTFGGKRFFGPRRAVGVGNGHANTQGRRSRRRTL